MKTIYRLVVAFVFLTATLLASCNKLVEIDPPKGSIVSELVFDNDASAQAAVMGIYNKMSPVVVSLFTGGTTIYSGLSADELSITSATPAAAQEFATNTVSPANTLLSGNIWTRAYGAIYQANACIEGLSKSQSISAPLKNQLLGESKLIRGIYFFYLRNLFGTVPLVTTTDYMTSAVIGKTSLEQIDTQILKDFTDAESLLTENYPSAGNGRPNKYAATALLGRFYLYQKNWTLAEAACSRVIESKKYSNVGDLTKVFQANSPEVIWQVESVSTASGYNTIEASLIIPATSSSAVPAYAVSDGLLTTFESGDKRKAAWTNTKTVAGKIYTYPYKYRVPRISGSTALTETYSVIRLSEIYLIRAEARLMQGVISGDVGALADLDVVRLKAGLGKSTALLPQEVQLAIERERRVELMFEWGHRWLDLKRWNKAGDILGPLKPGWQDTDVYFPIPEGEILLNPNLQ